MKIQKISLHWHIEYTGIVAGQKEQGEWRMETPSFWSIVVGWDLAQIIFKNTKGLCEDLHAWFPRKWRINKEDGDTFPPWYGFTYYDFPRSVIVGHIVPFNIVYAFFRRIYYELYFMITNRIDTSTFFTYTRKRLARSATGTILSYAGVVKQRNRAEVGLEARREKIEELEGVIREDKKTLDFLDDRTKKYRAVLEATDETIHRLDSSNVLANCAICKFLDRRSS